MLRYILISLLIAGGLRGSAQTDSLEWGSGKWAPSFLRIGANVYRGVESLVIEEKASMDVNAEIDFHKFFLVGEYGRAEFKRTGGFDYSSSGNYFKAGLDMNLIPYNPDRDVITLGLRYAQSNFSDDISFQADQYGNTIDFSESNPEVVARWIELNVGMKVNMWKGLTIGYVLRGKVFKRLGEYGQLEPFDIPGFGRHKTNGETVKNNTVSLDYYLYWTIPFRKKHIPPNPKRR